MEILEANSSFTSWSKLLRCSICLGVYRRPHTLQCGHSFCTSCLKNLARLTKEQLPQCPFPRLKFSCPTCRKRTLVSSVLNRRLHVNYSIQDFVDNWREQDKKFQDEAYVAIRSIATQSDDSMSEQVSDRAVSEVDLDVSVEEDSRLPCRIDAISFPKFDGSEDSLNGRINGDDFSEQSDSFSDTSSNSDLMDNLDRLVVWNRQQRRPMFVGFVEIFRNWIYEIQETLLGIFECRSRSVMALIWCGYTFSIMIIANGFFPYMVLYSFLFFIILYAESAQQRRNRMR